MENPYLPLISFLAFGTLLTQITLAAALLVYFLSFFVKEKSPVMKLTKLIGKNAIVLSFIVAALATISSLFLSEVAGFRPCELCWFQRIVMYPQVVVLGVAYFVNDLKARITALILSIIGLFIGVYHILVQFFPGQFKCSDEVANCALKQISYFGYITIPVMSATAFVVIIVLLLFSFRKSK